MADEKVTHEEMLSTLDRAIAVELTLDDRPALVAIKAQLEASRQQRPAEKIAQGLRDAALITKIAGEALRNFPEGTVTQERFNEVILPPPARGSRGMLTIVLTRRDGSIFAIFPTDIRVRSRAPDIIEHAGMFFVYTPQSESDELIYRPAWRMTLE
jgi:hypothetical protein